MCVTEPRSQWRKSRRRSQRKKHQDPEKTPKQAREKKPPDGADVVGAVAVAAVADASWDAFGTGGDHHL